MKNTQVLQYTKDGKTFFVKLTVDDPKTIQSMKRYLDGVDYILHDHNIKRDHVFYSQYILELDKSGYLYLSKKKEGLTKVKGKPVINFSTSIELYKKNITKILNNWLKDNGDLKIMAPLRKRNIWKRILTNQGFTVKETYGLYRKKILIVSK